MSERRPWTIFHVPTGAVKYRLTCTEEELNLAPIEPTDGIFPGAVGDQYRIELDLDAHVLRAVEVGAPAPSTLQLRVRNLAAAQLAIQRLEARQQRPMRECALGMAGAFERLTQLDQRIALLRDFRNALEAAEDSGAVQAALATTPAEEELVAALLTA